MDQICHVFKRPSSLVHARWAELLVAQVVQVGRGASGIPARAARVGIGRGVRCQPGLSYSARAVRVGLIISKSSYYYDTIIRYYIGVIMCYNVL
jgi:hypothetical protein